MDLRGLCFIRAFAPAASSFFRGSCNLGGDDLISGWSLSVSTLKFVERTYSVQVFIGFVIYISLLIVIFVYRAGIIENYSWAF